MLYSPYSTIFYEIMLAPIHLIFHTFYIKHKTISIVQNLLQKKMVDGSVYVGIIDWQK